MTDFALVIAHRDRGRDPNRAANLESAVRWWRDYGIEPLVVDDGRSGDDHWCRSAAYNRAARMVDADIIVYSEADILIDLDQILAGVRLARRRPGLVVPFSRFMAMTEHDTDLVRRRVIDPSQAAAKQVRRERTSIGAVNIVSRRTLDLVGGGYDERFEGHAYDDDAMEWAFRHTCRPTRFVDGPAWHQWHVPGAYYATPESTEADLAATERNRQRWNLYRRTTDPDRIRALIRGAD